MYVYVKLLNYLKAGIAQVFQRENSQEIRIPGCVVPNKKTDQKIFKGVRAFKVSV
jgi:hypothetical protein